MNERRHLSDTGSVPAQVPGKRLPLWAGTGGRGAEQVTEKQEGRERKEGARAEREREGQEGPGEQCGGEKPALTLNAVPGKETVNTERGFVNDGPKP